MEGCLIYLRCLEYAISLNLDDWTAGQILGCIFGVAGGVVLIYAIFILPYLCRRLVLNDWTLRN